MCMIVIPLLCVVGSNLTYFVKCGSGAEGPNNAVLTESGSATLRKKQPINDWH